MTIPLNTIIHGDALEVLRVIVGEPTLAYCAGILDGEGYVGIKKSTWGMRNRKDVKSPTYSERVQIRMSDREIVALFKKIFGGTFTEEKKVYQSRSGFKASKRMFCYRASDLVAANLIRALFPYLIAKRRQAELLLKLRESKESKEARMRGGRTQKRLLTPGVMEKREKFYRAIREIHGH